MRKQNETIVIRVRQDVKQQLEEVAKMNGTTLSALIREILETYEVE